MKRHTCLSLLILVLVALFSALPASADPTEKQGVGSLSGEFKVFDNEFLAELWTITCSNGDTTSCYGSGGGCLRVCEEYCNEPCVIILE